MQPTPFNGGAPLTQDQIQQARTSAGIDMNPNTATAQMPASQRLAALQAGTYGQVGIPGSVVPISVQQEQTSTVGQGIRDVLTPIASTLMSLQNIGEVASGQPITQYAPQNGFTKYLEAGTDTPIQRVGANFDPAQGFTPDNIAALKDAISKGVDIGTLMAGGGEVEGLATGEEASLGSRALQGAKLGGTAGAIQGASTGLNPDATVGGTIKNTIEGGLGGAALGGVAAPAIGAIGDKLGTTTAPTEDTSGGSGTAGTPEFNKSVTDANKVNNPYNMQTPEDKDFLNGSNATTQGKGPFQKAVLKPEVMAADPHNELQRELLAKGVTKVGAEPSQNIAAIEKEASAEHSSNKAFLSDPHNDVPVKYADLKANIEKEFQTMSKNKVFTPGSAEQKAAEDIKDTYLEEIGNAYKNQPLETAGSASGAKNGIEAFNARMKKELGADIYKGTPQGSAKIIMSQAARKSGYDTIQQALQDSEKSSISNNTFASQAKALGERAKNFNNREDFISQMEAEGSNSQAESKMHEREGTANPGTAASDVSESGLNVNERGKGYTTTAKEDLGEIWDQAHQGINSTKGDAWKASLQREAKLYALRDEMKFRTNAQAGSTSAQRFFQSPKGYALRRILRGAAGAAGGVALGAAEFGSR